MKTYISVGIGDMMCLDSFLTDEERKSITEIYWATHAGKYLVPLMDGNGAYPNLRVQHLITDAAGRAVMQTVDPRAVDFWHFRPDFGPNFGAGLTLFGLEPSDVNAIDCAAIFYTSDRTYMGSSFLDNCGPQVEHDYILFHYPTSTRPRSDIATITEDDWNVVEAMSLERDLKVIVVADHNIDVPLSNYELLVNPDIKKIVNLAKHCDYYAGCDSFCAVLACQSHSADRISIKSHNPNIRDFILSDRWTQKAYMPQSVEDQILFHKPYLGWIS